MNDAEYPSKDRIAFPSTGNAAEDDAIAEGFVRREKRLIEGICANGCGPMNQEDAHTLTCPKCGFNYWSNTPLKTIR